jgi:hypothetical protein
VQRAQNERQVCRPLPLQSQPEEETSPLNASAAGVSTVSPQISGSTPAVQKVSTKSTTAKLSTPSIAQAPKSFNGPQKTSSSPVKKSLAGPSSHALKVEETIDLALKYNRKNQRRLMLALQQSLQSSESPPKGPPQSSAPLPSSSPDVPKSKSRRRRGKKSAASCGSS